MKFLLLLIVIASGIAGYVLPTQWEGTQTNCAAVSKRMRMLADAEIDKLKPTDNSQAHAAVDRAMALVPGGATFEAAIRAKLPFLPPEAGCAAAYWYTVFQPDLRTVAPLLFSARPAG